MQQLPYIHLMIMMTKRRMIMIKSIAGVAEYRWATKEVGGSIKNIFQVMHTNTWKEDIRLTIANFFKLCELLLGDTPMTLIRDFVGLLG